MVVVQLVDVVTMGMEEEVVVSTVAVFSSLLFFSAQPPWYRGQHSSLCLFSPVSPGGGTGAGVEAGAAGVGLVCWAVQGRV